METLLLCPPLPLLVCSSHTFTYTYKCTCILTFIKLSRNRMYSSSLSLSLSLTGQGISELSAALKGRVRVLVGEGAVCEEMWTGRKREFLSFSSALPTQIVSYERRSSSHFICVTPSSLKQAQINRLHTQTYTSYILTCTLFHSRFSKRRLWFCNYFSERIR